MRSPVVLLALLAAPTLAAEPSALRLNALPSDSELFGLLWKGAPELVLEQGRVEAARAENQRAHLLPNPSFEAAWSTIPIGTTNPEGLPSPLTQVPNYSFAFSQPFEIGKRGPRQDATKNAATAAKLGALNLLRDRFFALRVQIAEIAADELRIHALETLATDASRLTEIQRARAKHGEASELDADRSILEEQKLASTLSEQREKLAEDLRVCAQSVGRKCEPFGDFQLAASYLERRPSGSSDPSHRPDVLALDAQKSSAEANLTLAHRQWIPDPTLRFGYVRDQFVISGNQLNSLFFGVSFPLRFFDHGQADARAAQAQAATSDHARALILSQAQRDLSRLQEQSAATEKRRKLLKEKSLPLARSLSDRLEAAVQRGAAPIQELLLTRRTLGELLVDSSDLDLAAFRLANARAQVTGQTPPAPAELSAP